MSSLCRQGLQIAEARVLYRACPSHDTFPDLALFPPCATCAAQNLDSELRLDVAALSLTCHRPTVAALMGLGSDMAYCNSLLAAEKAAEEAVAAGPAVPMGSGERGGGGGGGASLAVASAASSPSKGPAGAEEASGGGDVSDVVRPGGEGRTLLRLSMSMQRLQLLMPYEVSYEEGPGGPGQQQQGLGAGESGESDDARPRVFAVAAVDNFRYSGCGCGVPNEDRQR